jgi:hypothetical protein
VDEGIFLLTAVIAKAEPEAMTGRELKGGTNETGYKNQLHLLERRSSSSSLPP